MPAPRAKAGRRVDGPLPDDAGTFSSRLWSGWRMWALKTLSQMAVELWGLCMEGLLLAFKGTCFGASSLRCRSLKLGCPMWGSSPLLLGRSLGSWVSPIVVSGGLCGELGPLCCPPTASRVLLCRASSTAEPWVACTDCSVCSCGFDVSVGAVFRTFNF